MRHAALRLVAVLAVLLAGCVGAAEPRPLDDSGPAAVAAVGAVAEAQTAADGALADVLSTLRAGDETVRRARGPASVDAALEEVEDVRAELENVDLDAVGDVLDGLERATVGAQQAVRRAASDAADTDAWLTSYLEAELAVLAAVEDHATAGDELREATVEHREALLEALTAVADVASRRGDLRDAEEAAAAVEIALRDTLEDLIEAQEVTAEVATSRSETGAALNAASADAAAVAERRPAS